MKNYRIIRFFIALLFVVLFTIITIVVLKTSASNHEQELQYFNEGKLIMYAGNDGNLTISWPEAPGAQSYHLKISAKASNGKYKQYKDIDTGETHITLDNLPQYFGIIITCNDQDETSTDNNKRTKLEVKDLFIPSAGNFL